jgi:hypothetical protein
LQTNIFWDVTMEMEDIYWCFEGKCRFHLLSSFNSECWDSSFRGNFGKYLPDVRRNMRQDNVRYRHSSKDLRSHFEDLGEGGNMFLKRIS